MKGITQLVGAVLLILIALGGAMGVLMWTRTTTQSYRNESEQQLESEIKSSEASFVIYDINKNTNKITVKNIGKTKLKVKSFQVYLNNESESVTRNPSSGKIDPSEKLNLTVSKNLNNQYLIDVTGPYGLSDGTNTSLPIWQ